MKPPRAVVITKFLSASLALLLSSEFSAARAEDIVEFGDDVIAVTGRLVVVRVEMKFEDNVEVAMVVRFRIVATVVIVERFKVIGGGHNAMPGIVQLGLEVVDDVRSSVSPPPSCLFEYDIQFQMD